MSFGFLEQSARHGLEMVCQPPQQIDRDVACASLNLTDVGGRDTGVDGDVLLTASRSVPRCSKCCAERVPS